MQPSEFNLVDSQLTALEQSRVKQRNIFNRVLHVPEFIYQNIFTLPQSLSRLLEKFQEMYFQYFREIPYLDPDSVKHFTIYLGLSEINGTATQLKGKSFIEVHLWADQAFVSFTMLSVKYLDELLKVNRYRNLLVLWQFFGVSEC